MTERDRLVRQIADFVAGDTTDAQRLALADAIVERFSSKIENEAIHWSWEMLFVRHGDHVYLRRRLEHDAPYTGSPRYRVVCTKCDDAIVLEATCATTVEYYAAAHVGR